MAELPKNLLPINRIEALSDGIFAITMTLIILGLRAPENIPVDLAYQELPAALQNLYPDIETYVLSFILLGIFWLRHQIQFKYIVFADRGLLAINILFLMFTGFIPFSVGLMMRYTNFHLPFLIYICNLLMISIILNVQWFYVTKNQHLLEKDMDPKRIKIFFSLSLVPIIIFIISLLISFFNVRVAFYVLVIDPLFYFLYRKYQMMKLT